MIESPKRRGIDALLVDYPYLERADILQALQYAAWLAKECESPLERVCRGVHRPVDISLSPRWIGALSEEGVAATNWSTVGMPDAPDAEIMRYARDRGFAVLTHDPDFYAILAVRGAVKPSV